MDAAVKLAALQLHVECGHNTNPTLLSARAMQYLPPSIATHENMGSWQTTVLDEWRQLKLSEAEAEWKYVKLAEKLPLYGAELFGANKVRKDPSNRLPKPVGIAVNNLGITFYDEAAKRILLTLPFNKIEQARVEPSATNQKMELVFDLGTPGETRVESPRAHEIDFLIKEHQGLRSAGSSAPSQRSETMGATTQDNDDGHEDDYLEHLADDADIDLSELDASDSETVVSDISEDSDDEVTGDGHL